MTKKNQQISQMKSNQQMSHLDKMKILGKFDGEEKSLFTPSEIKDELKQARIDNEKMERFADIQINKQLEKNFHNPDFNQQIEQLIEEKIKEGKSDQQILKEVLIGYSSPDVKTVEENEKTKKILEVDAQKSGLATQFNQLFEKGREEFDKRVSQENKMEKILEENQATTKPLTELPTDMHKQKNRKLTYLEKQDINVQLANLQDYLLSIGVKPEKKYNQSVFQTRISSQEDPNRLSYDQKLELLHKIQNNPDLLKAYLPEKEKIEIHKRVEMKLEALNIDTLQKDRIKKLALEDSVKALEELEKLEMKKEGLEKVDSLLDVKNNSFKKSREIVNRIAKKYNLTEQSEIQVFKNIQKECVFWEKKQQEEDEQYKIYLEQKERMKRFRQYEKKLHEVELRKNIDFNEQSPERVSANMKNFKSKDMLERSDYVDKVNALVEKNVGNDNWLFQLHQMRTKRRMIDYLNQYFASSKQFTYSILDGQEFQLDDIVLNEGLTKVTIYWKTSQSIYELQKLKYTREEVQRQYKRFERIKANLIKHESYLSARICQDMGFRYGPKVKFVYSSELEEQGEISNEIRQVVPDITLSILMNDLKMDKIRKSEYYNLVQKYTEKLEQRLNENLSESFKAQRLKRAIREQKAQKQTCDENGKRIRNNRDENGKRLKKPKVDKVENFWKHLSA